MIYDIVIGLGPPHRLGGALTSGLLDLVYAGVRDARRQCLRHRTGPALGRLDVLFGHPSTTELTLRTR